VPNRDRDRAASASAVLALPDVLILPGDHFLFPPRCVVVLASALDRVACTSAGLTGSRARC
jgi:hypothetical protein